MIHTLRRQQVVRASLEEVWDFFSTPRNLDALTPDELSFRIVGEIAETMYEGQIIEYRVRFIKGIWSRWVTEITHVRDKSFFVDEQRLGPYKLWHHEHHFIPEGDGV
ncbi:MAG TPA: SRPBCC family protein, partial [bacterium]|nr:SRPBCC family protein [bacterium]